MYVHGKNSLLNLTSKHVQAIGLKMCYNAHYHNAILTLNFSPAELISKVLLAPHIKNKIILQHACMT